MENMKTAKDSKSENNYIENEFSLRAIISGIFIGILMLFVYVYVQVITGLGIGVSALSALLGLLILPVFGRKASKKEINIVQTISSSVAVSGAVVTTGIPALILSGYAFNWSVFIITIFLSAIIGICVILWIRKPMIEDESLTFPQAQACKVIVDKAESISIKEKKLLVYSIILGVIISGIINIGHILPPILDLSSFLPKGMIFGIALMPMLLGLGYMIGFEASIVIVISSLFANLILAPIGTKIGWYPDPKTAAGMGAMQNFNMSFVIGIAIFGTLIAFIKKELRKNKLDNLINKSSNFKFGNDSEVPLKKVMTIGFIAFILIAIYLKITIGIGLLLTILSILLMAIVAVVDVRCMAEIGLTIAGLFDLVLIFVLGSIIREPIITLFIITIAVSVLGMAGDMMNDWKTGKMIGASQKKQLYGQFIGVIPGVLMSVLVLYIIMQSSGIGTPKAPFPVANMFYSMAQASTQGATAGIIDIGRLAIGAVIGTCVAIFNLPAVAVALSLYLPVGYMVTIALGGLIRGIVKKYKGVETELLWTNAASGILLSDAFVSILTMAVVLIK